MNNRELYVGRILAQVLQLQRWAGGESIDAARVYGLLHGFESVIQEELEGSISREVQDKVERMLDDIDRDKQSVDGLSIKDRLRSDNVDETEAWEVVQFVRLSGRFGPAISKLSDCSVFQSINMWRPPEADWFGALHYMEIVDCTEETHKPLHAVYSPSVPRVGEIIEPDKGSKMRVVKVSYVMSTQDPAFRPQSVILVPYVYVEPIETEEETRSS